MSALAQTSKGANRAHNTPALTALFSLPVSVQAFNQLQELESSLLNLAFSDENDTWEYIWGSSLFSSRKAYRQLLGTSNVHPVFKWLWKSSCQHKHMVFFWLLVQDRLSTRSTLRRKSMPLPSYDCVLCGFDTEETVEHLFLHCVFAKTCWSLVGITVPSALDPFRILEDVKLQLNVPFFMEIIVILSWSIWTVRNNLIFNGVAASAENCRTLYKSTFGLVIHHAKKKYFPAIEEWLDHLL
jgi:hypothetical protein